MAEEVEPAFEPAEDQPHRVFGKHVYMSATEAGIHQQLTFLGVSEGCYGIQLVKRGSFHPEKTCNIFLTYSTKEQCAACIEVLQGCLLNGLAKFPMEVDFAIPRRNNTYFHRHAPPSRYWNQNFEPETAEQHGDGDDDRNAEGHVPDLRQPAEPDLPPNMPPNRQPETPPECFKQAVPPPAQGFPPAMPPPPHFPPMMHPPMMHPPHHPPMMAPCFGFPPPMMLPQHHFPPPMLPHVLPRPSQVPEEGLVRVTRSKSSTQQVPPWRKDMESDDKAEDQKKDGPKTAEEVEPVEPGELPDEAQEAVEPGESPSSDEQLPEHHLPPEDDELEQFFKTAMEPWDDGYGFEVPAEGEPSEPVKIKDEPDDKDETGVSAPAVKAKPKSPPRKEEKKKKPSKKDDKRSLSKSKEKKKDEKKDHQKDHEKKRKKSPKRKASSSSSTPVKVKKSKKT